MNRAERDRLRAILRAADPAAGVDGPPAAVAGRMRRSVLAAATERSPAAARGGAGLRWATAAALSAALGFAGATLLRDREGARGPGAGPPVASAAGEVAAAPATRRPEASRAASAEVAAATPAARPEAAAAERRPTRVASLPAPTAAVPAAGEMVASAPAPLQRQIQVTAPGGTRIIWILTSEAGP